MGTLSYLAILFSFLFAGMLVARLLGADRFHVATSWGQSIVLWSLLFFMGVNTGGIPDITSQLATIGTTAVASAVLSVVGTFLVSLVLVVVFIRKKHSVLPSAVQTGRPWYRTAWDIFKEPLALVLIVGLGICLRLWTPLFNWFDDSMVTYLLYALLFGVGMSLVQGHVSLRMLFGSPVLLLLPVCTILGSWLGALVLPMFVDVSVPHSMALASGFGWYSLSGIMISDLGYPVLGSISFLANLFRESLSFFLIPLLGRLGSVYAYPAVCIAGATSMDVTLPLLTSRFGSQVVGAAIFHGVVITLAAPLLIPLFF